MLKSMTFNGQRNNDIYLLKGRSKSPYHGLIRNISRIGKHHRLRSTQKDLLPISQPIGFTAKKDEDHVSILEELTDWLITDDFEILSFDNEPGRRYLAILQSDMGDLERISILRKGTLEFVAIATLGADKTISISTSKSHKIGGQESTPWSSTTTFTAATDQYILESKIGKIILNYDFIQHDVLEIDYNTRSIKLNGDNMDVGLSLESEWFELEPGYMTLKASHETEMAYTERYH